jgi:hypothetical protein
MMRRWDRLVVALALVLCMPPGSPIAGGAPPDRELAAGREGARSQQKDGAARTETRQTKTHSGIPLDEPISIEVRGVLFRVPAGYLDPWPTGLAQGVTNKRERLSVAFWMPDKRPWFRPREPGRALPRPDEYIVDLTVPRPFLADDAGDLSPIQRYKNLIKVVGAQTGEAAVSFEKQHGLLRFWHTKDRNPFTYYRHLEGTHPQLLLRCTPPEQALPNPVCDGYVHFESDGLGFYVVFSRDNLARWREIVTTARELLLTWRVSN